MPEGKNIYQRMSAAMKEIGAIKKDRRNQLQNYEYLSEEAVKTGVHTALVKHGILFTLSGDEHLMSQREGTNSQGRPIVTTTSEMKFTYRFSNIDDPSQSIEGTWCSMASDNSDKSHTKAITYAIREILKSNFVISTGEPDSDPDGETPEIAAKPIRQNLSQRRVAEDVQAVFDSDYGTPPACPNGHGPMRLRQTKTGASFWGCTAYPNCKMTKPAARSEAVPPTPPPPVDEEPQQQEIDLSGVPF